MGDNLLASKQASKQYHYDLLRLLLVILVVLGHATYYSVHTQFGSIRFGEMMREHQVVDTYVHKYCSALTSWIYSFHMPVFVALSGSVFALSSKQAFTQFAIKKTKRLLIPLIAVWFLWNLPIKYVSGYYQGISWEGIFLQVIFPANVYLWYLESLFWVFIISYFLRSLSKTMKFSLTFILWLIGLVLYRKMGSYHPLGDPLYYLLWFYIGSNINFIIEWMKCQHIWNKWVVVLAFFVQVVLFQMNEGLVPRNTLLKLISLCMDHAVLPFLMFLVLNYLVLAIPITPVSERRIDALSQYCFGVYLYAEPLNYLLLYLFHQAFGIGAFGSEWMALGLYLARILMTPLAAVGIVKILMKLRLKYLY